MRTAADPGAELTAFLEVDLGTEGTRFFGRKIDRYLDTQLRYRYGLLIEFRVESGLVTYSQEWKEGTTESLR